MPVNPQRWEVAPAWLTIQEAALLVEIDPAYVQAMVNALEVETRSENGRVLISKDSLVKWNRSAEALVAEVEQERLNAEKPAWQNWRENTWSIDEAAERMPGGPVHRWTVYHYITLGLFGDAAFQIGTGQWRIRKDFLRTFHRPARGEFPETPPRDESLPRRKRGRPRKHEQA